MTATPAATRPSIVRFYAASSAPHGSKGGSDWYVTIRKGVGLGVGWGVQVDENHRYGFNQCVGGETMVDTYEQARERANAMWTAIRERHPGRTRLFRDMSTND